MTKTLGSLLAAHIDAQGVSHQDLSARAKVPPETISRIVNGHRMPSASTLRKLTRALKLTNEQTGRLIEVAA